MTIVSESSIESKLLQTAPVFGGRSFKKNILNLVYLSGHYGLHEAVAYWQKVVKFNAWQKDFFIRIVVKKVIGIVNSKRLAAVSFAFNAHTVRNREPSAIRICRDYLEEEAKIAFYDPKLSVDQIGRVLDRAISNNGLRVVVRAAGTSNSGVNAVRGVDAVQILIEWLQFRTLHRATQAFSMRQLDRLFVCCGIFTKPRQTITHSST